MVLWLLVICALVLVTVSPTYTLFLLFSLKYFLLKLLAAEVDDDDDDACDDICSEFLFLLRLYPNKLLEVSSEEAYWLLGDFLLVCRH